MAARFISHAGRHVSLRVLLVVSLMVWFAASVRPASAAFDWCSSDPVFTFQRGGLLSSQVLDVQVLVPLSELPLSSAAQLDVVTPSNVRTTVVNPPNPVFPVAVTVSPSAAAASESRYGVKMVLDVPASTTAFPVRLLVTNPLDLSVRVYEGVAGTPLAVTVDVGR